MKVEHWTTREGRVAQLLVDHNGVVMIRASLLESFLAELGWTKSDAPALLPPVYGPLVAYGPLTHECYEDCARECQQPELCRLTVDQVPPAQLQPVESTRPDEALVDVARDCGIPNYGIGYGNGAVGVLRGCLGEGERHLIRQGVTYVTAETADELRRLARDVWPQRNAAIRARDALTPPQPSRFD